MTKDVVDCEHCLNPIYRKRDKYVLLGTYEYDGVEEEKYYHFDCWKYYFKKMVEQRLGQLQANVMQNLKGSMRRFFDETKM